ncbi:hypothetical protein PUNSTDRAFT_141327 [Punctularia strigosozonata HHB-11173 SS5]|uniref:uncharacterized protein n=1 Tax=Punctularia strigosozonata (strain HHB-11173) TaxID=741275 RepID=UPI0004416A0A|nr:uncharacterized protein PUNSTDRAFT_141327 [Punctularia strigosozonata HHB-11173 SS5]EIN12701.1 hypothetical protein PUNSTDRAFT_141327 [Punctularia strigosozonata HHB-11173 SS5]
MPASVPEKTPPRSSPNEQSSPSSEYESGRVKCDDCGTNVSFRDDITDKFTTKHWDLHKQNCRKTLLRADVPSEATLQPDFISQKRKHGDQSRLPRLSPPLGRPPATIHPSLSALTSARSPSGKRLVYLRETAASAHFVARRRNVTTEVASRSDGYSPTPSGSVEYELSAGPSQHSWQVGLLDQGPTRNKRRRRTKRSEQERIQEFHDDPLVAQVEPYRVLCKKCNKWIRLRSNSTYCSIPWDAHRSSCVNKENKKRSRREGRREGVNPSPFTSTPLTKPDNREEEDELPDESRSDRSGGGDVDTADDEGMPNRSHRLPNAVPPPLTCASASIGAGDSRQGDAQSGLQGNDSSRTSPDDSSSGTRSPSLHSRSARGSSLDAVTAAQEGDTGRARRRSLDERAADLRGDPHLREVEAHRVLCAICDRWIQLRQDAAYCTLPWTQHREKCLERSRRRLAAVQQRSGDPAQGAACAAGGEEAAGCTEEEQAVDLTSSHGRHNWVARSLCYLQATTYRSHGITVGRLTQYLNATMPGSGDNAEYTTDEVRQAVETLDYAVDPNDMVILK